MASVPLFNRSPVRNSLVGTRTPKVTILIGALLALYSLWVCVDIVTHPLQYQNDFRVYYYAAAAHKAGFDPYDPASVSQVAGTPIVHRYIYPPLTLYIFRPFCNLDFQTAYEVYFLLKCVFAGALFSLWRKVFLRDDTDILFYAFCLLAFNAALYIDLACGNITMIEQFLLWVGFSFLLNSRPGLFVLFTIAASMFKISSFLFLLLLLGTGERKHYAHLVGGGVLFLSVCMISYTAAPELHAGFFRNLSLMNEGGIVNPSSFELLHDLLTALGNACGITIPPFIKAAGYVAFVALVILLTWRGCAMLRSTRMKNQAMVALFLVCLGYALSLPRFKDYSYTLLLVPSYYIMKRSEHVKAFVPVFILTVLSASHVTLPGGETVFHGIWNYYPLLTALLIWLIYLYEISSAVKRLIPATAHVAENR